MSPFLLTTYLLGGVGGIVVVCLGLPHPHPMVSNI
jgi:hypothetical protein